MSPTIDYTENKFISLFELQPRIDRRILAVSARGAMGIGLIPRGGPISVPVNAPGPV